MSVAIDTDPRFGRFTLRTECPSCGAHLPVDGPAREVDCAECGHRVEVPLKVLTQLLDAFEEGWPTTDRGTVTTGDLTWRWTSDALDAPECPACRSALGEPRGDLAPCAACGAQVPARPPPEWIRSIRGLRLLFGGDPIQTREDQGPAPIALSCPSCGAGLTVTSRHHRLTPCDRCGSQVHLPDAVWRALHPARVVQPWLARFDGESRPAARLRKQREADERQAEKQRERDERRRRQEEEQRTKAEIKAREEEAERAVEAERRRARERWTLLPTGLCLLLSLGCVALLATATAAFFVGHIPGIRIVGLSAAETRRITDGLVVGAVLPIAPVWLLSIGVAAFRGGHRLLGVLAWSAFMSGLTLIPFVGPILGWFWAWQHFTGSEPTPGTDKLPRFTGWPLALLYATVPAYLHLWWGAAGDAFR